MTGFKRRIYGVGSDPLTQLCHNHSTSVKFLCIYNQVAPNDQFKNGKHIWAFFTVSFPRTLHQNMFLKRDFVSDQRRLDTKKK